MAKNFVEECDFFIYYIICIWGPTIQSETYGTGS